MIFKIHKNSWNGDVISPFKFINNSYFSSNKYQNFSADMATVHKISKDHFSHRRLSKYGIQARENYVNNESFYFHEEYHVNNAF